MEITTRNKAMTRQGTRQRQIISLHEYFLEPVDEVLVTKGEACHRLEARWDHREDQCGDLRRVFESWILNNLTFSKAKAKAVFAIKIQLCPKFSDLSALLGQCSGGLGLCSGVSSSF